MKNMKNKKVKVTRLDKATNQRVAVEDRVNALITEAQAFFPQPSWMQQDGDTLNISDKD